MKRALYLAMFLAITAALAGGVLSLVNDVTKDTIAEAQIEKEKANLIKIFPDGKFTQKTDEVADVDGLLDLFEVEGQGYVYKVSSNGYGGEIIYLVGFNQDNDIAGIAVINHTETPGFGDVIETQAYTDMFKDKSASDQLDVVSGATVTSNAINKGIVNAAQHLSGGKLEVTKPELILGEKVLINDDKVSRYIANIDSKEDTDNGNVLYEVSVEGYGLKDSEYPNPKYKENVFEIEADPLSKKIVSIKMLEFGDTEGFGDLIDNSDYLDLFVGINSSDQEVDTVTNATKTSYSLISAIAKVLEDIS